MSRTCYSFICFLFFFSSRRRHTRYWRDWNSDVCSSDLKLKDRKKNKQGRPRVWDSVEAMQAAIDEYFAESDANELPYTVAGLAGALGMGKHSLMNYQKTEGYEQFFTTKKQNKKKIESNMVSRALANKVNPRVAIFLAKAKFGYSEQPQQQNTDRKIIIEFEGDDEPE